MATKALRAAIRKETHAEARAAICDAALDDAVLRFSDDLLRAVGKDTDHPRYRRYFTQPPSRFIRNARLQEATTVKSWVSSIKGEPEPEVARHAELLAQAASASIEALDSVASVAGERASSRVKEWGGYMQAVDAARDALYASLIKRGQDKKKPRGWASRFFRTRGRVHQEDDPTTGTGGAGSGTPG